MLKRWMGAMLTICMLFSLLPAAAKDSGYKVLADNGQSFEQRKAAVIAYHKEVEALSGSAKNKYAALPDTSTFSEGALTPEYMAYAMKTLNFARFLAGLPDDLAPATQLHGTEQKGAMLLATSNFGHYPSKPKGMSDEYLKEATEGTSKSNIADGYGELSSAILLGWMGDHDAKNIKTVGHRLRCLGPSLTAVSFGEVNGSMLMNTKAGRATVYDAFAYPSGAAFPSNIFPSSFPWSVSLSMDTFLNPEKSGELSVTLFGDGQTYKLNEAASDYNGNYFSMGSTGYNYYIIFRPKMSKELIGEYTVTITGLRNKANEDVTLSYNVNFFDINGDTPQSPSPTPNPPASLVTITRQPTSMTVTEGSISGSFSMEASAASGTLTYRLGSAKNANTTAGASIDPRTLLVAEWKLSPTLTVGTHYYFFYIYLDGKLATTSDIITVRVLKLDASTGFLEILPYNRIESGPLDSYEKVKGKPTVVVFGSSYGCTYPGIYAGYKLIKDNALGGKVNLLAFAYGMNESDAQTAARSDLKADWYTLYNAGGDQMWALLEEKSASFPVIAYFGRNGNLIRYRTSREALDNAESDFKEMLDKSGVAIPTLKPSASSLVTIDKQPAAITMVIEGKITESIRIDASASGGKLTYSWGIAKTDDTPPTGTLAQIATPDFKLNTSLKAGTYYYFCVLYVDGKEAARSSIATVQVVKAEETKAENPETAGMKKGVNILSYPTKTTYAVGEGFDTTGAKVVNNIGEKLNDVTANIVFYTSKTVQLTQGRTFTTTGEKVVELRQQDGTVIGKYTITVGEKGAAAKHPFADIKGGAYYEAPVIWALQNNVTAGTSVTTFSPNDTCTRGQVVTFLWRAKGQPEPASTHNPFTDVKADDYYYKAVLWAVENGITSGTSATAFSPGDICTSAQVVTFLWRSNDKPKASGTSSLAERYGGQYYTDAVAWADATGLLFGTGTAFAPNNNSPRADIVTYLYRNGGSPEIQHNDSTTQ
ncbi:MAG: S-layer homology domain-containing protein [Firmicutes bacterium]|nr:S-layer homology domain-containing protein [Bacillota bacterium]